jgi:hypothetical protein
MSATTVDRNTPKKATDHIVLDVAASTKIPAGAMAARNSSGDAVNAADATGLRVLGRCEKEADNSAGSAGDIEAEILPGIFLWENDESNPVTDAHVGSICYVKDNQTVQSAAGTYGIVAGVVTQVDSGGVWVDSRLTRSALSESAGLTVTVANAETPDGDAYVTIQSVIAARQVLRVWFAATAMAAPADLGTLTATTGAILKEDTDDALATVVTDANGLAVLNLDLAVDGTVHCMVERNGLVATDSEAITGNA